MITPVVDGDSGFVGVDMRLDPSHLPDGYVAFAENCRFTNGIVEQRRGVATMNWGIRSGDDDDYEIKPLENAIAAQVFRDPNGVETVMVAAGGKAYQVAPNNLAREIPLPDGEVIGDHAKFVQAFDTVLLLRGEDKKPLRLNTRFSVFEFFDKEENSIEPDAEENPSDGTESMPNASEGIYFSNRVAFVHGRDKVAVSDYLNYTRYDPVRSEFRINQGTEDSMVGVAPVDKNTVAFFKENSIYVVRNFQGDLSNATLDELTRAYGCAAAGTITRVGRDIVFLSRRGLCSLTVTEQGEIQGVDVPLSKPVDPLIQSIDWKYAHNARCVSHNNKIYLAVPLVTRSEYGITNSGNLFVSDSGSPFSITVNSGGDTVSFKTAEGRKGQNNCIIVYDMLNQSWSGIDTGLQMGVVDFLKVKYNGAKRLVFLSNTGFFNLYDDETFCSSDDEIRFVKSGENGYVESPVPVAIDMNLTTRGYLGRDGSKKRFHRLDYNYSQRNALLSVDTVRDGAHEVDNILSGKTFSNTKYIRPFDKPAYDTSNANNDHNTEGREDYSVFAVSDSANEGNTSSSSDTGKGFDLKRDGVRPNSTQYYSARKSLMHKGSRIQVKFGNARGLLKIHSVGVSGSTDDNKSTSSI